MDSSSELSPSDNQKIARLETGPGGAKKLALREQESHLHAMQQELTKIARELAQEKHEHALSDARLEVQSDSINQLEQTLHQRDAGLKSALETRQAALDSTRRLTELLVKANSRLAKHQTSFTALESENAELRGLASTLTTQIDNIREQLDAQERNKEVLQNDLHKRIQADDANRALLDRVSVTIGALGGALLDKMRRDATAALALQQNDEQNRKQQEEQNRIDEINREQQASARHAIERKDLSEQAGRAIGISKALTSKIANERWRRWQKTPLKSHSIPKRRNRPAKLVDRILCGGRSPGVALAISRSGLWNRDFLTTEQATSRQSLLGYARAGSHPDARARALFDHVFYRSVYPDVAAQRISPLAHYLIRGDAENRQPHPLVSATYYRRRNEKELNATGLTVLQHFLAFGAKSGCNPHLLFDVKYYVGQIENADELTINPLVHYLNIGWRQGLNPHPLFANDWYLQKYHHVASAMIPPLLHYVTSGAREGLDPHPLFFGKWYLQAYPDVASSGMSPLEHYITTPAMERRNPNPYFSAEHYLTQIDPTELEGRTCLEHYAEKGAWSGLTTSSKHPDLAIVSIEENNNGDLPTPLETYINTLSTGSSVALADATSKLSELDETETNSDVWEKHRQLLNLMFDAPYYYHQLGNALSADEDPLAHYIEKGWKVGLNPHPLFETNHYLTQIKDIAEIKNSPLVHYIEQGAATHLNPHPMFSSEHYVETYPEIVEMGELPLVHFIHFGGAEGRSPSAEFSTRAYLDLYPDIEAAGINPVIHLLTRWPLDERHTWPLASARPPEGAALENWIVGMAGKLTSLKK